jgi:hypothetical protein
MPFNLRAKRARLRARAKGAVAAPPTSEALGLLKARLVLARRLAVADVVPTPAVLPLVLHPLDVRALAVLAPMVLTLVLHRRVVRAQAVLDSVVLAQVVLDSVWAVLVLVVPDSAEWALAVLVLVVLDSAVWALALPVRVLLDLAAVWVSARDQAKVRWLAVLVVARARWPVVPDGAKVR